jgi:hypothetical protein
LALGFVPDIRAMTAIDFAISPFPICKKLGNNNSFGNLPRIGTKSAHAVAAIVSLGLWQSSPRAMGCEIAEFVVMAARKPTKAAPLLFDVAISSEFSA